MTNEDIKNRLKELRGEINLTQQELADKLGISRQSLIALEKGRYRPSFPLMILLEDFFKEPIREIFGGRKDKHKIGGMMGEHLPFQRLSQDLDQSFGRGLGVGFPKINLYTKSRKMIVEVETPGISEKDLEVDLTENTISISGRKEEQQQVKKEDYYYQESSYGSFSRTVNLPVKVDSTKAKAEMEGGRLVIAIPLAQDRKGEVSRLKIKKKS